MSPWVLRAGIVLFVIAVDRASPMLAYALVSGGLSAALIILLVKGRYLPRFIMDVLDRLTDKGALERAYDERRTALQTIDSAALAGRIKGRVVGQDPVVERLSTQLRRRFAAKRKDKPIAVLCFAGPPGVGKTLLAKVLAEELYGDRNHLHFFDMSQFGQPHAAASLFGQARGYVGSQSYGALTAALRDVPDAVVLLDEFEKAHPEVHKRFLTAWNDGFVTELSDGSRITTREAIFILTTNAASRRIGELAQEHRGSAEELDKIAKSALHDAQFAPEILSRIDEVMAFRPLQGLDIARVVALEIELLARQYELAIVPGGIEPDVLLNSIQAMSGQMDGGIRDVARAIERDLGDALIDARAAGAVSVRLQAKNGKVHIAVVEKRSEPSPSRVVAE